MKINTKDELIEALENNEYEDVVIFENPDYAPAFRGVSSDNRAVCDFYAMVDFLIEKENMTAENAVDFISYNSSFTSMPPYPIVIYPMESLW